jgi:hypothetical protein
MNRKFAVVTTFHDQGLKLYGQRMIDTFTANWPSEVKLHVYAENTNPRIPDHNRIELVDVESSLLDLVKFKNKWKSVPYANGDISKFPGLEHKHALNKPFRWDAVRFSHKVYSIFHCAKNTDADVLIWMDADTVCHSPITLERINDLIPVASDLCFLGRGKKYTECGLYTMNLRSAGVIKFLESFQHMYDTAETGIFKLQEWHDSFVFDHVRCQFPMLRQVDWCKGSLNGEGHPLINSDWGAYLDHLKGARKTLGRSKASDLKVKRNESYWK